MPLIIAAAVVITLGAWLVVSSALFVRFAQLSDRLDPTYQLYAWWLYATNGPDAWTTALLALSAFLPALVVATAIRLCWRFWRASQRRRRLTGFRSLFRRRRTVERGLSDNLGHADWMSVGEALRHFQGPAKPYGGKVVGELPDRRLLIDPCSEINGLSLEFAGPGSGKTSSAVTTLLYWPGASVVLDPSCEVGPMLFQAMRAYKKRVVMLAPGDGKDRDGQPLPWADCIGSVNVLDWIDIQSPLAALDVRTVVEWLSTDQPAQAQQTAGNGQFFRQSGRDLFVCILAHVLWEQERITDDGEVIAPPPKTLATLREFISLDKTALTHALRFIQQGSHSGMARALAGPLVELPPETFGGVHKEGDTATSWLTTPVLADLVSGGTFRTTDIASERVTVFVQVPLTALESSPAVARVLIGALCNAMIHADGNGKNDRVLFLIDEAARLGRMKVLETLRDAGRKYRVAMHLLFQSVGQLEEIWEPNGRKAWYDAATWRAYSAVRDADVAKAVSATLGSYAVMAYSEGDNSGSNSGARFGQGSANLGRNLNRHEIKRELLSAAEVISDLAPDEMLVLGFAKPLRVRRAVWWKRPEVADLVVASRFFRPAA